MVKMFILSSRLHNISLCVHTQTNKQTDKKTITKQESVFDKHKCPRKHNIIKQMFSVFAYFSRKRKQNCKDNNLAEKS